MPICIMRTGSPLQFMSASDKMSTLGQGRDDLGLIYHLLDKGHELVVYGRTQGTPPDGVTCVGPKMNGFDEYSSGDEIRKACEASMNELVKRGVKITINPSGPTPTCTWPDNPEGILVYAFAIRYVAPALLAWHELKLPRLCYVTDIRNYPKDKDFNWWPETIPQAVLSQENFVFPRKVHDLKFNVHAVYSGAENFWLRTLDHGPVDPEDSIRKYDCGVFAHTHLTDGRLKSGRADAWETLLSGFTPDYIHGKHWGVKHKYYVHREREWREWSQQYLDGGVIPEEEMFDKLSQTLCGPMMSMRPSFNSCKLGLYAYHGALPLPYGRFDASRLLPAMKMLDDNGKRIRCIDPQSLCTYDGAARYVPLDADIRVTNSIDLLKVVRRCHDDPKWRNDWVRRLQAAIQPDFSLVDECIEHFQNGGTMDVDRFGGYAPAR